MLSNFGAIIHAFIIHYKNASYEAFTFLGMLNGGRLFLIS